MKVTIVQRTGGTAAVEWREGETPYRATLPLAELTLDRDGRGAECGHPEWGIPFGEDFSALIHPAATGESIDRELKRAGIWTVEDLLANPNGAAGALQRAYGVDLATLLGAARAIQKGRG